MHHIVTVPALAPKHVSSLRPRAVRAGARLLSVAAALLCVLPGFEAPRAAAQDTRTVTEPAFPVTCTALAATQPVVTTGTPPQSEVNFSGEPASETAFDTARIQAALTACPAGQAVELTTDATGANNAFLIAPLNIPKGVTLLVDAGVTVFGSRNPADYQVVTAGVETCGTVGTKGNGCNPLLTINNNSSSTGSGIMGFGVINARGGDKLLVNGVAGQYSWWDIANQANTGSAAQNNPILLYVKNASSFTLYKITLINSPMFHVKYQTASGFTVWGVKIVTPYSARNTDGIDPDDKISNITIANSFISDGDDDVAIGASGSGNLVSNVSIVNTATHAGHGISIGSYTSGGVSNVLVNNVTQAGDTVDSNSAGVKIKSASDRGGAVTNIVYQNICMQNQRAPVQFNPIYDTTAGTLYPSYQGIVLRNVTDLTSGNVDLDGLNANYPLGLTLDNVNFLNGATLSPAAQYANITVGPGPVTPASLTTSTGTGVTYTGGVTNPTEAPYACTAASFPTLAGELFLSTLPNTSNAVAGQTNQQALSVASGAPFTLNAVIENTDALFTAPSAAINFLEAGKTVGTATLSGNGTLAQLTVANATSGTTHTYTAQYAGDATHPAFAFGSVTVTVAAAALPVATMTTVSAPATANFGTSVTISASVTAASGTVAPTGTVTFMNGNAQVGPTVALVNGTATYTSSALPIGTYQVVAVYSGATGFTGSSSMPTTLVITQNSQTITLSSLPASVAYGSAALTVTATASSGLPVTLAVTGPASLTGSTLAFTAAGTVKVTASQAGNTQYAAATPAAATITVTPATLVVTPANATIQYRGAIPALTGTIQTLVNGDVITAAYSTTATATSAPGTYPITATLSDPNGQAANYNVTLNTGTLTITPATTTVTLSSVSAGTYAGETLQLVATVAAATGVPATGTATLMNGNTVVSTATVTSGLATFNVPAIAAGSYPFTATYGVNTNYTGSTSAPLSVVIVPPVAVALTPSTLALAAGATGSSTLAITPGGGFAGAAQITCTSPVAYVTCSTTSAVPVSGMAASDALTVTVAGSARLTPPVFGWDRQQTFLAGLAGLGALAVLPLAFGRRRWARLMVLAVVALGASVVVTGCGGPAANNTPVNLPPAGNQALTITVLASGQTVTTTLTVNVTN